MLCHMHGSLRQTYALLANYMAKCQMSSGPYGPIFFSKVLLLDVESNNADILPLNPLLTEKTHIFVLRGIPDNFTTTSLDGFRGGGPKKHFTTLCWGGGGV